MKTIRTYGLLVLSGFTIGALLASSLAFELLGASSILWAGYFILREVKR